MRLLLVLLSRLCFLQLLFDISTFWTTPEPGFHIRCSQPNKVYIGGLPEHTREEDLKNCFGKIGDIVNIELKLGYGFVVRIR